MSDSKKYKVAIVDYHMGNLFNIKNACAFVGLDAFITSNKEDIVNADAVILPGVGAFGIAMENLRSLDLTSVIKDVAASGKPFLGVCLGLQLIMSESYEFGHHQGLGLFEGSVVRLESDKINPLKRFKVPHVAWSQICPNESSQTGWQTSLLQTIEPNEYMYFVHSYYVKPKDHALVLSWTQYGDVKFCSSIQQKNIMACQFHPERSGVNGLRIYRNLFNLIKERETDVERFGSKIRVA